MSPAAETPLMIDPNEGLDWTNVRAHLLRKFQLPQNAHLLNGQSPEEAATRKSVNVLGAFVGFPKAETVVGEKTLLRVTSFRDPYDRRNQPNGEWWFSEAILLKLLNQFEGDLRSHSFPPDGFRRELQSRFALSDNFSDVEQLWCIRLKAGAKLTGLAGLAAPQPVDSSLAGSYLNMGILPGRAWQYYFPNLPADCVVEEYPLQLLEGMWFPKKPIP